MKTLEIKIESGTYLVLELPEEKESAMLKISIQIEAAKANALTDYEFHGKPHFRDNERLRWAIETINKKFVDLCCDAGISIPPGSWQPIGFGKDHPELVEKLGLLRENPVKPHYDPSEENMLLADKKHHRKVVQYNQAETKVFKNPYILEKQ